MHCSNIPHVLLTGIDARTRGSVPTLEVHTASQLTSYQRSTTEFAGNRLTLGCEKAMPPLDLVKLTALMELTSGRAETRVGLIDGPVAMDHPDLSSDNIRALPGKLSSACTLANSIACMHGTFVAGILCASGVPQPRQSAPTAPCWCDLFLQKQHQLTDRCQARLPRNSPPRSLIASKRALTSST